MANDVCSVLFSRTKGNSKTADRHLFVAECILGDTAVSVYL